MSGDYREFVRGKRRAHEAIGFEVAGTGLHESLFPHQRDVVAWALHSSQ